MQQSRWGWGLEPSCIPGLQQDLSDSSQLITSALPTHPPPCQLITSALPNHPPPCQIITSALPNLSHHHGSQEDVVGHGMLGVVRLLQLAWRAVGEGKEVACREARRGLWFMV